MPQVTCIHVLDATSRPYRLFGGAGRIGAYETLEEAKIAAERYCDRAAAEQMAARVADAQDFDAFSPRLRALHDAHLAALAAGTRSDPALVNAATSARLMALAIHRRGIGSVNVDSSYYRAACKSIGIRHTRRDISAFLAS